MRRTHLPRQIQMMLKSSRYAVIATVNDDGKPWNTPVAAVLDDELNLYWASALNSQHSRNIAAQPDIFAVLFGGEHSTLAGNGLYLQMQAQVLTRPNQIVQARKLYDTALFEQYHPHMTFLGNCPTRLYRARPIAAWCNQDSIQQGYFVDTRQRLM